MAKSKKNAKQKKINKRSSATAKTQSSSATKMQRDEQDRLNAANAELETILTTFSAEKDDNETDLSKLKTPISIRWGMINSTKQFH